MDKPLPVLTHETIELRVAHIEDVPSLYRLIKKNEEMLRQWLPWLDTGNTEEGTRKHIEKYLKLYEDGTGVLFTIRFQGEIAGVISFNFISKANKKASIGYWLDADRQGQGIMTTACRLLIAYGFGDLHLNRIEISCAVGNEKSCAIPKRLGFVHEGIFRQSEWLYDHFVDQNFFALLAKDWKTTV